MNAMNVPIPALRQRRHEAAMTQVELAESSGLTEASIVRLEHGQPARMSTIRKLAKALKVKPIDLIRLRKDEESGKAH